jgi:parallel beta-helix repeat protein
MLTLLLAGTLALVFNVGLVHAQYETVYINSDGSVSPPSAPILSLDNITYALTGSVTYPTYNGIVVERNNIIIDGNGYVLEGGDSDEAVGWYQSAGLNLTGTSNVTIKNANIQGFYFGIYVSDSNNDVICGNNITDNSFDGINVDPSSSNITLSWNNITSNGFGIDLEGSSNTVNWNEVTSSLDNGIWLNSSTSNTVSDNNASANGYAGIELDFSNINTVSSNIVNENAYDGIDLEDSSNNSVSGNNVTANHNSGIWFDNSSNNTVSGNDVASNGDIGISLYSSSYNTIYHNNFVGNVMPVFTFINSSTFVIVNVTENCGVDGASVGNLWDNGYPSGGNYWSDYNGTDLHSGQYQNLTGSDGIGDTPYIIDANDMDNYPLTNPYSASSLFVSISPGYATLDVGQSQVFTSIVTGGTLPYTYQWCLNGSAVPGATFSRWAFAPTLAGSDAIYANVTDSLGEQVTSNTATVTVNGAFSASISPGSATLDVLEPQLFTSAMSGGTPPYTYQWYLDYAPVSGATSDSWTFAPTSSGSYTVYLKVTDNESVIATSNIASVLTPTRYNITFGQVGVGLDYTGTVVTIDGTNYTANDLPLSFLWDSGSTHTFAYQSPLTGKANTEQYVWTGTSGLSSLQSGSINVTADGSIIGNYKTQYNVTFDKTGVGSDFTGPIVIIDGSSYNASALPTSFWYDSGSTHSFAFQTALVASTMTYYWNSTTGLSALQSGSINVTGPGSITGNYVFHEVIVTNVTASTTWIYRGGTPTVSVTVKNVGDFNESVSVTLYYNVTAGKSINTYQLYLGVGQSLTLTYTWNTNGIPYQNYTLTAVATIPTGSSTLSDGNITIKLLGDVNGDGRVDLRDIALVARALGSTPTSPNWNPACDFYSNGTVNMKDIALVARNFGQQLSPNPFS